VSDPSAQHLNYTAAWPITIVVVQAEISLLQ